MYGPRMTTKRVEHGEGERVTVTGEGQGTVVDKTRGDATRVKLDSGATLLIANKIIRKL